MARFDRSFLLPAMLLFGSYAASLMVVDPRGEYPLNDDWVYARDCIESARAGHLELTKYESAWSLPQIILGSVVARAVGFSHAAFRAFGIASLLASGLLIDAYLRRSGLPPRGRLIALAAWIYNPVGYLLGLSFMTDLPFMALWVAACYCWDMALASGRRRWIAAAAATTMIAMAQRQFALFIPAAAGLVIVARWAFRSRRAPGPSALPRPAVIVSMMVVIAASLVFFAATSRWMAGNGAYRAPFVVIERLPGQIGAAFLRTAGFLAVSSAPLAAILIAPRLGRFRGLIALGAAVLATGAAFAFLGIGRSAPDKSATFGNTISEFGLFTEDLVLIGRRPEILGRTWSRAIVLLSWLASLAIIRLACGIRWGEFLRPAPASSAETDPDDPGIVRPRDDGFGIVLIVASAMMLPVFLIRGVYFDRYLLPVLPAIWVILARCSLAASRARLAASIALVVFLAGHSITLACDYFRWNDARWIAANRLVARGIEPRAINAGYEWFGMMVGDSDHPVMIPKYFDYVVSFSGPPAGFREIDSVPWRSIWPPHDRKLHVLENEAKVGR